MHVSRAAGKPTGAVSPQVAEQLAKAAKESRGPTRPGRDPASADTTGTLEGLLNEPAMRRPLTKEEGQARMKEELQALRLKEQGEPLQGARNYISRFCLRDKLALQ